MFKNIVMQMRKGNCERGYYFLKEIDENYKHKSFLVLSEIILPIVFLA